MLARDSASPDESPPSQSQALEITNPPIEEKSEPLFLPNAIESSESDESDALARSISSMLCSLIRDFDHRSDNVTKGQDQLSSSIDRLTRELDQLLDDAPLPFIRQHAAKIAGVRERVLSLNALLKSIQRRINNVDRLLSAGILHEKRMPDNSR